MVQPTYLQAPLLFVRFGRHAGLRVSDRDPGELRDISKSETVLSSETGCQNARLDILLVSVSPSRAQLVEAVPITDHLEVRLRASIGNSSLRTLLLVYVFLLLWGISWTASTNRPIGVTAWSVLIASSWAGITASEWVWRDDRQTGLASPNCGLDVLLGYTASSVHP